MTNQVGKDIDKAAEKFIPELIPDIEKFQAGNIDAKILAMTEQAVTSDKNMLELCDILKKIYQRENGDDYIKSVTKAYKKDPKQYQERVAEVKTTIQNDIAFLDEIIGRYSEPARGQRAGR